MCEPFHGWQAMDFAVEINLDEIRPTGLVSATRGRSVAEAEGPGGSALSLAANRSIGTNGPIPSPSLLGMAASVTKSAAKFAASGFKTVALETHRVRVQQCGGCQYHNGNRCRVCGCFFEKKAWLPHEDCPIGKWTA
jgi:hypothetical protein